MNGEEPNIFNGLNTQMINTAIETMRNNTEMAKVTFSVRSEWNGGFSVMSTSKDFRLGAMWLYLKHFVDDANPEN